MTFTGLIFIGHLLSLVFAADVDKLQRIKNLRELVKHKIFPNNSLIHSHIRDDLYIHQWLDTSDYKIDLAYSKFMQNLKWRQSEKIDQIDQENWSYFKSEYPQFFNTHDKVGRPVAEVWISEWNIRRAILSGQRNKLRRWNIYLLEMVQRRVFEIRNGGKVSNITSAVEIIDLDGLNPFQHTCLNCASVFTGLSEICEKHYPRVWKTTYMVNVGPSVHMLLNIGKTLNYAQKSIMKMYTDKKQWLPVLDREISNDQRSKRFGGNIERSV